MPEKTFVTLTDTDGTTAVLAPELGGWLLRYARKTSKHGLVDALQDEGLLERSGRVIQLPT